MKVEGTFDINETIQSLTEWNDLGPFYVDIYTEGSKVVKVYRKIKFNLSAFSHVSIFNS